MANDTPDRPHKTSVRRSLLLSFAQKYTNVLLTVPTIMLLSRLLTPAEIGIFSVAMAVTALVHMLRDFGVSEFVVQHASASDDVIRSAFTINLIIAWLLGAGLFSASGALGAFYATPSLTPVLQVIAGTFFLMPFGSTVKAMLRRRMAFAALYKINTAESVVRAACAIGLAFWGLGAMSLAWANLAAMAASIAACAFWGGTYRVRGLSLSRWREVTHFGVLRATGDIVVQIGVRSPDIVIGRLLGMSAAGLYSRGYGLVNMFRENVIGAVNAVAFPSFADHHRTPQGADAAFLQSLTFLTGISWPFFLFAALMAFPIIRLMFGAQWDAAVPLAQWLAAGAMIGTLIFQCNHYFTAIGRVGTATRIELVFQAVRVAVVIAAALQGLVYVAAAQVLVYTLAVALYYQALQKLAGVSLKRVLEALRPSFWLLLATGLGPVLTYVLLTPRPDRLWAPLLISGVSAAGGWVFGARWARHPIWPELCRLCAHLPVARRFRTSA